MEALSSMLQIELHRTNFHQLVSQRRELFVHFLHLLLGDMTWLLEEAMTSLSEVRKRESNPSTLDQPAATTAAAVAGGGGTTAAEQSEEGREEEPAVEGEEAVGRLGMRELQERTRTFVSLTHKSCALLVKVARYFGKAIVESKAVLPQMVTCLDCCLHHLVGPRCLQLKVKNNAEYAFDPKDLLACVCETYLHLYATGEDQAEALGREICGDGRYFQPQIFMKAVRIVRRESILPSVSVEAFNQLAKRLMTYQQEELDVEDVPDEFLDPLMQDVMEDPVRLPTSNTVMDRRNIERHLMADEHDPYNRAPLRVEELESMPELREKIRAFLRERKQKQSGNNDGVSPGPL
eukprot:GHVS01013067.1.p1 GENE.GHVS01013067.1~~GHVS01013067.1.p1  ORF type:complete len:349 (+),score=67.31 GHVS01013067.1:190-1236(+)